MTAFEQLQQKLHEIFQLDKRELDFGIYRIMNLKADEIAHFIDKDLLSQVKTELAGYAAQENKDIQAELNQALETAKNLGVDPETSPKVVELRKKLATAGSATSAEIEIYSHLYNFFKRYYCEGDFISQRRYKDGVYALPYEGEEVKLYWANADQYYIKSGENFTNYTFKVGPHTIRFEVVNATTEQNNNKETKERRFNLVAENPVRIENGVYIVSFSYLPDPENRKQNEINAIIGQTLLNNPILTPCKALLAAIPAKSKINVLAKHLNTFTEKNTSDYFIHKNLGKFLRQEMDFYIKNEIMHLDDIEAETAPKVESYLAKVKVFRKIADKIITFLASLEDFQKKLWLKKKFVLETNYCITLDRVPEKLYAEIATNEAQRKEWVKLFAIDEIGQDTTHTGYSEPLTVEFLKENPFLVLDTAFFSAEFKYELLACIDDLDKNCNGLLIHSENFQALNLLQEKYREKVQCIYIDPPFNTGNDFYYKDSYQNSSWLSLMYDRIKKSTTFLTKAGNYFLHLDENANCFGKMLLGKVFNTGEIKEIIYNTNSTKDEENDLFGYKSFGNNFVLKHQTIFHIQFPESFFRKLWKPNRNTTTLPIGWLDLISESKHYQAKSISDFNFYVEMWSNGALIKKQIIIDEKIFPISDLWNDIFSFTQSEMRVSESFSFLASQKPENLMRRIIQSTLLPEELILDFFAGSGTTLSVAHKLNRRWLGVEMGRYFETTYIDFEKNEEKVGLLGRLKYTLKGDKRITFNEMVRRPHLSKDINWNGGGFFKYIRLESYEDTLDNLVFTDRTQNQADLLQDPTLKQEYMLNYMLNLETKDSLLNIANFNQPFDYQMRITRNGETKTVPVDLVETFNYLIGLQVESVLKIDNILRLEGRTRTGEKTLVLWRDTTKTDYEALNKWFQEHYDSTKTYDWDVIYVNGDNNLENVRTDKETWKVRSLEKEFLKRMFATQEA
ncbi:DNA methyltransferase [Candidatus Avelusimicrobium stercoris]|uniref:DNA methyltransferase n=1 Tax=Candidatus Avelusimicrobium stercoris TaxID=1947924 RepID=UPI003D0BD4AA